MNSGPLKFVKQCCSITAFGFSSYIVTLQQNNNYKSVRFLSITLQFELEMEIETGDTYLTEVDCNNQSIKQQVKKFKKVDSFVQNQPLESSVRRLTSPKFGTNFLKHTQLQYKQYLSQEYYEGRVLKPGTSIYKIILDAEQRRSEDKKIPFLQLRIPGTMVMSESFHSLIHTENDQVKITQNFAYKDLVNLLTQNSLNKQSNQIQYSQNNQFNGKISPTALCSNANGIITDHQIFLSNQIYPKLIPATETQACIKYIQPYGAHPNVLRLFYTPKSRKNWRPSIAYKIVTKRQITDEILSRKYKQTHNYLVEDYEKHQNVTVNIVRGKALLQVEEMTQSLIDYLEYFKSVKITDIVVDYIFGKDKLYYFHEIKSIKHYALNKIWDIGSSEQILNLMKQNSNQILCKLCALSFRKQQMNHRVTNKLIIQLITHLKNRGEDISSFGLQSIKIANLSVSCHVCDLCYELILAEHQLIDVQQQFQQILNMQADPLNRVPGLLSKQGNMNYKGKQVLGKGIPQKIVNKNIYQWRIFFYLQKLKNLPTFVSDYDQMTLTMKFKEFKEVFKKTIDIDTIQTTKCQIARKSVLPTRNDNLSNTKITLHTNHTSNTNRSMQFHNLIVNQTSSSIDLQKVKVFVFYTENPEISDLIQKGQLAFQLLFSDTNGKQQPFKMKGQSSTMMNFTDTQKCQQHSCEVLLFDEKYKYCNLQLNIGMKYEATISDSKLNYSQSEDGALLYSNNKDNQLCKPLPEEWIEIINHGVGSCMQEIFEDDQYSKRRTEIPKKQLKRIEQFSIKKKINSKKGSRPQSGSKLTHSRPQTCLLSQSSRDSIKKSKFRHNIISPINFIKDVTENDQNQNDPFL